MSRSVLPVTVVIPHLKGDGLLSCLRSIYDAQDHPSEVIVVQNGPLDDGSTARAESEFGRIRSLRRPDLSGYAGPCNAGIKAAGSPFVVLLNDDVEVDSGWLAPLVDTISGDGRIGACQPKLLSRTDVTRFDYSGAAGGLIDILCYPFCLGRVFDTCERDSGQYDSGRDIFWASGTAILLRKNLLESVGDLDEQLWMHMEEIDLCWRLHAGGYRVRSVPSSVVYHTSAATLAARSFRKIYLNHRNSLIVLLKNGASRRLWWVVPARVLAECVTVVASLFKGEWRRILAVPCALSWVALHAFSIAARRSAVRSTRRVPDQDVLKLIYPGSILVSYFLRGRREASAL